MLIFVNKRYEPFDSNRRLRLLLDVQVNSGGTRVDAMYLASPSLRFVQWTGIGGGQRF